MILVPRQLRRSGMTGSVPYYGGRLTPEQAYAAANPAAPIPAGVAISPTVLGSAAAPPALSVTPADPTLPAAPAGSGAAGETGDQAALEQLLSSGVITPAEFDRLRARVAR